MQAYLPVGVFPDQKARSAIAHLKAALAYYRRLGITVKRVMTDNGPCYTAHAFAATCKQLGLKHIRTQPYTPRTHGKAEHFIQTALREWAYASAYLTSKQRAQDLPLWTHRYNWHRLHSGIKQQTPIGHLKLNQNNLVRLHNYPQTEVQLCIVHQNRNSLRVVAAKNHKAFLVDLNRVYRARSPG